jgi:broad specificity phosphatase PhoE
MSRILFVTHPEVLIDPTVPVPRWPLSALGRRRMESLADRLGGLAVEAVWSSDEQKAIDGAEILAMRLGVPHRVDPGLGENDRSATGYIAPPEFWEIVEQFFSQPTVSVRGWETAYDAQARIMAAVQRVADEADEGLTVIISHGGVGRLLAAALQRVEIGREAKPGNSGGGCSLLLETSPLSLVTANWGDIDAVDPATLCPS